MNSIWKRITPLVLLCALLACHKKEKASSIGYAEGDVLTGIKASASVDSVFALFNRLGLQIGGMSSFTYAVPYPADKLDSISRYLNTKPYVDTVNWKVEIRYNQRWQQSVFFSNFFNMNADNQADWLRTVAELHLTDVHDSFSSVYLHVPKGTEKFWVDQLPKYNIIKWAELNEIISAQL